MATVFLVFVFAILSNLEWHAPKLEQPQNRLAQSYRTNLGLFAFNSILFSVLSVSSLLVMTESFSGKGLLSTMHSPVLKAVLSFLLLDLLLYLWHKACHNFDILWMFHRVHHNDPYLNVSTAFRIHLVELLITALLKAIYIILLGVDKTVVLIYETVYPFFVMFHHANISFRGEKLLGYLVITPYLHRAHHSKKRKEHDSNYGAIFSLWDRLLGTMKLVEPAEIGIKGDTPQTLWGLIKFGFKVSVPVAPVPASGISVNIHAMIAEAAYYKAEKRSFSPGYELYDWLEAKKEIIGQVYGNKRVNI
jgi:sterol desaturase/sphingolipid hydroxylase (fatty acid hydroxylase superfamily)